MAKKPQPRFRRGQLIFIINDGLGPILEPDFIVGITEYSKKHGWYYHVNGTTSELRESQMRRIKKKEIR